MTYWSSTSLISEGVGTWVMLSATSRSSSSARISLQRVIHSLQMYTDGPEMNFRTESFDFPQKEQRRCLSLDMEPRRDEVDGCRVKCPRVSRASSLLAVLTVLVGHQFLVWREYTVDQAVRLGFFRAHEAISVHVPLDGFDRLPGVKGVERVHLGAKIEDLSRLDFDVGRGTLCAARGLVN